MKHNNFRLSAAGKLTAAQAIILAASSSAYAAEIVAANGTNGPGVSTAATGAQVVDIGRRTATGCRTTSIRTSTSTSPARC